MIPLAEREEQVDLIPTLTLRAALLLSVVGSEMSST